MTDSTDLDVDGGIFADLGLDEVDADPNHLPDSTYRGVVYDAKIVHYKDAAKGKALVLTYKVTDPESIHKGKTIDEWKSANKFDDAQKKGWLKNRLISLGVPESRIAQVSVKDLIATDIFFTVKKKGEYINVTFVRLADESEVSASSGGSSSVSVDDLL